MSKQDTIPKESRQRIMKNLGEYGCYFLSLVHMAEKITGKRIDAVEVFVRVLEKKWVDEEATLLDPASVLGYMTGLNFTVRKDSEQYLPRQNEYEILQFVNGSYTHFVLGDGKGYVSYDPLGNSRTVAQGKCMSKRIFTRI